jgi:two-component system response regulator RegA
MNNGLGSAGGAIKVLVVDDDRSLTDLLVAYFKKEGEAATAAYSAAEGLMKTREFQPDIILLDIQLHEESGLKLLPELLMERTTAVVIMLTAFPSIQSAVEAMSLGAVDYLEKPVDFTRLKNRIRAHFSLSPQK